MAEVGTNIALKLNGNVIIGKLSTGFTSNRDEIELSDADDGADSVYRMGRKRREATGEFNLETTGTNNLGDIWDIHDGEVLTPFIYGGTDSGDFVLTGYLFVRDVEMSDPDNERSTVTLTMRISGTVTKTVYS